MSLLENSSKYFRLTFSIVTASFPLARDKQLRYNIPISQSSTISLDFLPESSSN